MTPSRTPRMTRHLVVFVLVVSALLSTAARAAAYPSCVEDNKVYSPVANGEVSFGALTPTITACATGVKSLVVAQAPSDNATIVAPTTNWMYAINAATTSGSPAVVSFTLRALCDAEVICEATLGYNVQAAADTTPTDPVYAMCTANSTVQRVDPSSVTHGTLPMDLVDTDCVYTTSVVKPTVGTLATSASDPFAYTFTAPATDEQVGFSYTVQCDGTVVCEDVVAIEVRKRFPVCSASKTAVTSHKPVSQVTGRLALDVTDNGCAYSTVIDTPKSGFFTTSYTDPFQFTYTSPADAINTAFSTTYRVMCDGAVVCEDDIDITLNQQYPTCSVASTTVTSHTPSSQITGVLALDEKMPGCVYTTTIDKPKSGAFTVNTKDPFTFVYQSPSDPIDASFTTKYRVSCGGAVVCEDNITVSLVQAYPECSRQAASITSYRPSSALSGRFPLDVEDGACTYTAVAEAPSSGSLKVASSSDPLGYVYTSPASNVEASTSITYRVLCDGTVVCQDVIAVAIHQSYPVCTAASVTRTHPPGVATTMDLPLDLHDTECDYAADLELPSVGSAVVMAPKYPLRYIFTAPYINEGEQTHLNYKVKCNGEVVCQDAITVLIKEDAPTCPVTNVYHYVAPESQLSGTLDIGTSCSGALTTTVRSKTGSGRLQLTDTGLGYTFTASSAEDDNVAVVRAYCDGVPLCDTAVAFIVTVTPSTTTTTTTTSSSATPGSTSTTTAPVDTCKESFAYNVPTGQKYRGTLHMPSIQNCDLVTFSQPQNVVMKGSLGVNILGDFLYQAPLTEGIEDASVHVSCLDVPVCRTTIRFTAYYDFNSSTTSTTQAPVVATCADVYFYHTSPGQALSSSLSGVPQQDPCAHGRYFSLTTGPQGGTLTLMPIGDFLYQPTTSQVSESNDVFTFSMYCMNRLYCNGIAYVSVSDHWTLPPTTTTVDPSKPVVITNKQITCKGTCDAKAWKTYPTLPLWDNSVGAGYARSDGRPVDGISVRWVNSSLVFTVYTLIGNLGVRFPTFEPLLRSASRYLESADFASTVASSSPGFEMSCLDSQGRTGRGEDVYHWDTMDSVTGMGTGSLGALYSSGYSWYQKFGGKHVQCDTFADSCHYAPFLTPAYTNHSGGGVWSIDVNDCDATWTGVFPFSILENMTKSDGSALWSFVGNNQLSGTLVSEAVRPSSWISPKRFDTHYDEHRVTVNLDQFVLSSKANSAEAKFSVDTEFFLYRDDATGDQAFGVNLLLYPHVTDTMETSFREDSHVVGFKWIEQDWSSPNQQECPTCTGTKTHCKAASDLAATSTFIGDFPAYDCPASTARVQLSKGPAMSAADCADNEMFVMNRTGFSATRGCSTAFQNITFRGIVPGSGRLTEQQTYGFNYAGYVGLELLMNTTKRQRLDLNISVYVSRLALDSPTKAEGGLEMCRSGSYWPLPDPLGTSLPDRPFATAVASSAFLCEDDLSSSYGPSDWALFTLVAPSLSSAQVAVDSVYVELNGGARVYLVYHDPATGAAAVPPVSLGHWWQHTYPFLAFRDLTERAANATLSASPSMVNSYALKNARYAFTMIPGTLGVDGTVEVVVSATVTSGEAKSVSTYRRMVHIDPLLTSLSRQGPPHTEEPDNNDNARSDFYAIGVTAGITVALIAVVIFFMVADKNRPLPKWVPRGKVIKRTVLSVVPHGLRKESKAKPVVHRDMYDAMNSGRY